MTENYAPKTTPHVAPPIGDVEVTGFPTTTCEFVTICLVFLRLSNSVTTTAAKMITINPAAPNAMNIHVGIELSSSCTKAGDCLLMPGSPLLACKSTDLALCS
mmetsp:Transcript_67466/g.105441  ORF Transcript_67466/g.105441 Transcript_67466/m.105441 type:complete len:103 (+) Transcript_67466:344-652(+)